MIRLVTIGSRTVDLCSITRMRQEGKSLTVHLSDGQPPWSFTDTEAEELGAAIQRAQSGDRDDDMEPSCPDCGCKMARYAGPGIGEHGFVCLQPGCFNEH